MWKKNPISAKLFFIHAGEIIFLPLRVIASLARGV
jgi:hypothetical protein